MGVLIFFVMSVVLFLLTMLMVKSARKQAFAECMLRWCEYGQTLKKADELEVVLRGIRFVDPENPNR